MADLKRLESLSAALAADLASGLQTASEVFDRHGISETEARSMLRDPSFMQMVKQFAAEWSHVKNTKSRLRLKAQLALEESMLSIFKVVTGNDPAAARVAAFKELKQLAGMDEVDEVKSAGTGLPSVVIYLGGDKDETIDITPSKVAKTEVVKTGPESLIWEDAE